MKVFVAFLLFVAVAVAFPTGEPEEVPREMQVKMQEQRALLAFEGDSKGDKGESEAERAKRDIIISYPYYYSYPFYRTRTIYYL